MSRWSRSNDEAGNLLPRSGSFSSSSQPYQPLTEDESQQARSSSPVAALPAFYPPSASPPPTYSQYQDAAATPATAAPAPLTTSTKSVTVNLRTLSGQVMPLTFSSLSGVSVLDIKRRAEEVHQIPVSFQRLIFSGRELVDTELATAYGMDDGSMLHLLLRQATVPQPAQAEGGVAAAVDANGQPIAAPIGADGQAIFNGVSIPIQPPIDPYSVSDEDSSRLTLTMQMSRVIKILALIDFLWLFVLANAEPMLLAFGVLALAGFWGAHSYNKHMIAVFSLYLVGSIALRIYIMANNHGNTQLYVLLTLGSLVDLYLLRAVGVFYRLCARLLPGERAELQMLNRPNFHMG